MWRWVGAFSAGGVDALVWQRPGPKRASKLTEALSARIVELQAGGLTLQQVAEQVGVSTATVRVALGRVSPRDEASSEPASTDDDIAGTVNAHYIKHAVEYRPSPTWDCPDFG